MISGPATSSGRPARSSTSALPGGACSSSSGRPSCCRREASPCTRPSFVPHEQTVDYGELACYQPRDLRQLAAELSDDGFEIELNLHVSLDTPPDRWVSVIMLHGPELAAGEFAHLKLAAGDSVITSVGLIVGRPHA
jgi:hypothetical protein